MNHIHKLIDRLLSGMATPEEKEEMQEYFFRHDLQEDVPEPGSQFYPGREQSKRMYQHLIGQLQPDKEAKLHRINSRWLLRVAAVLIPLVIASSGYLWLQRSSPFDKTPTYNFTEIKNNSGSIRYLRLKDGSEVWLNKNAVLKLDTSDFIHNRQLFLQGEAYFDISHDPEHPLVVSSGLLNTHVLGTSFSINSNSTSTNVTLFTGKVSLDSRGTPAQILSPGQSGEFELKTGTIRTSQASAYAIAWKTQEINCKNERLESIIHFLKDYYGTSIRTSKSIAAKEFSGTLSLQGNLSSVLSRLLFVHQLQFRKNQDGSIVIF